MKTQCLKSNNQVSSSSSQPYCPSNQMTKDNIHLNNSNSRKLTESTSIDYDTTTAPSSVKNSTIVNDVMQGIVTQTRDFESEPAALALPYKQACVKKQKSNATTSSTVSFTEPSKLNMDPEKNCNPLKPIDTLSIHSTLTSLEHLALFVADQLTQFCEMCDGSHETVQKMLQKFPALMHKLSRKTRARAYTLNKLYQFIIAIDQQLAQAQAEFEEECSVDVETMVLSALNLIEKSFNHSVYIHSFSSERLFAVVCAISLKFSAEFGCAFSQNVNEIFAELIGVPLTQFNKIEIDFMNAVQYDVAYGVAEGDRRMEKKKNSLKRAIAKGKLQAVQQLIIPSYQKQQAKSSKTLSTSVIPQKVEKIDLSTQGSSNFSQAGSKTSPEYLITPFNYDLTNKQWAPRIRSFESLTHLSQ